ncbi:MAG: CCA tRNA nucleotidyltransferase [Myxococcota bacterium]
MKYPDSVKKLFRAFEHANHDLYLVGGAVRDWALGEPVEKLDDLDFCTDARPETTAKILRDADFQLYELGAEFGTVGAIIYGEGPGYPKDVQITTYRSEEYYRRGSRHPTVEFGDTIEQDLGRRDFSINSMALDGRGDLHDPYDGKSDLEEGILRVIGDPYETLAEDPLRILRIGRFMSKLGFEPTESLREAASQRASGILDISAERWLQEMTKLLKGPFVSKAMRFLHDVRILGMILPEIESLKGFHASSAVPHQDLWNHTLQVVEQAPRTKKLRWAALLHDIGKRWTRVITEDERVAFPVHEKHGAMLFDGIARRFRLDNETAKEVRFLIANHGRAPHYPDGYQASWTEPDVRRWALSMDPFIDSMLALARANITAEDEELDDATRRVDELARRIQRLEEDGTLRPELPSGIGNDLMDELGLAPSPLIGDIKDWLEEEIIEERIESNRSPSYYVAHLRKSSPDFLTEMQNEKQ